MECTTSFSGQNSGFQAGHIHGNVTAQISSTSERSEASLNQACLRDLPTTAPRDDKDRIEKTKGGLLKDSYRWILDNDQFKQWREAQDSHLLWIKGDPGKGKTMLLCGIIDELEKSATVSFFFCQATDARINSATAVLRGLIYMLVGKQPSLLSYVRQRYDIEGKRLFEDINAWVALSRILTSILEDPTLQNTYLIIDALDECSFDLPLLLDLIVRNSESSTRSRVKWIVSSRNWPHIEEHLQATTSSARISLELNEASVSDAVDIYIEHKVRQLSELKKYSNEVRDTVSYHLLSKSQGTFLWVALVWQELMKTSRWNTISKLNALPPGLNGLYERMLERLLMLDEARLCKDILAVASMVYRPITLHELTSLVDMPNVICEDYESLAEITGLCGSFLTLREQTIIFVHQSARDFLVENASAPIFMSGIRGQHYAIFSRSLQIMRGTLRRDIYQLGHPGFPIEQVRRPDPDPLAAARYSCMFWVDHLCDFDPKTATDDFDDSGVNEFLAEKYLYWLEALSLIGEISRGTMAMLKLEDLLNRIGNPSVLTDRVIDGSRFIRYHRSAIEENPLQVYCSALLFSPSRSITKTSFQRERPDWVSLKTPIEGDWRLGLQTLEGHLEDVQCVAWSHDGTWIASASYDRTIKVWDPVTGQCQATLEGHNGVVETVAWSYNGARVASGSDDRTVKIWDLATAQCILTLKGHNHRILSVSWSCSYDDARVVSGSGDDTIRIWDAVTGCCILILEGHSHRVRSVAWSHDGTRIVSGSRDETVGIWDLTTGQCILLLRGHDQSVESVAWNLYDTDGSHGQIVSGSYDQTVRIWDVATGLCVSVLRGHTGRIMSVSWSRDGSRIASGSDDKTVRIWDPTSGQCTMKLGGHGVPVQSVSWLCDGTRVALALSDTTVRIWNLNVGQFTSALEGHSDGVCSVAWSPDRSRIASGSQDKTIRIWDPTTGQCMSMLKGHSYGVQSIVWSNDGALFVSNAYDSSNFSFEFEAMRVWDPDTGQCISTLKGHSGWINSIVWSCDRRIASVSGDKTVGIWDPTTGQRMLTLEGHTEAVDSVAWSPDGRQIASGSNDRTIRIWDLTTGQCTSILEGHRERILSIAWSQDGSRVASGSEDQAVKIWDLTTSQCVSTLGNRQYHYTNFHTRADIPKLIQFGLAILVHTSVDSSLQQSEVHYGLLDLTWINYNGRKMLRLPPEYRAMSIRSSDISGANLAIGCTSGRLLILTFSQGSHSFSS